MSANRPSFNALTADGGGAGGELSFCTIEPNVGDVAVPDARLETLASIAGSKEIYSDAADVCRHRGPRAGRLEGRRARQSVSGEYPRMRCDAHIVRCFEDSDITHVEGQDLADRRYRDDRDGIDASLISKVWKTCCRMEKKAKAATRRPKRFLTSRALSCIAARGKPARLTQVKPEEQSSLTVLGCSRRSRCSMCAMSRKRPRKRQ